MAINPVIPAIVIASTIAFTALLQGQELLETAIASTPEFLEPTDQGGFFDFLDPILAVVKGVWVMVALLFNLITFNVPGAPWYIRLVIGTAYITCTAIIISGLVRGGGT